MKKSLKFGLLLLGLNFLATGCNTNTSNNTSISNSGNSVAESSIPTMGEEEQQIYNIYLKAQQSGYAGTYDQWLDSIKGKDGVDGKDGADGKDGKDGSSVLTGKGSPASSLGSNGDSYIDLDSFDFYTKASGKWSLKGNISGKDINTPVYESIWEGNNLTFTAYNGSDELMLTIKINDKGVDYWGNRYWFYGGYGLPVLTDENNINYFTYTDAVKIMTIDDQEFRYNCAYTAQFYKDKFGFEYVSKNTKINAIAGASNWYKTSKASGGYDGILNQMASFWWSYDTFAELQTEYPNMGVFFHISNNCIDEYYVVTDTSNAESFSYWAYGSIENIGSTVLDFEPEMRF